MLCGSLIPVSGDCQEIVRAKIDLYEGRITDPTIVWEMVEEAQRRSRGVTAGIRTVLPPQNGQP